MADIIQFRAADVGDGVKIEPTRVLANAPADLSSVVVIGRDACGELYFASSDGGPDTLWLIESAKQELLP